jgi:hypothetical protein
MMELEPLLTRMIRNLADRVTGPLQFRLILQPAMALFFAVRDGVKDAREGSAPYFWRLFTQPERWREWLRIGWKSIGKVFLMAVAIDAIYQFIELRWFYPGEALVVAFILACIPYLLIRGPVNRIVQARKQRAAGLRRAA